VEEKVAPTQAEKLEAEEGGQLRTDARPVRLWCRRYLAIQYARAPGPRAKVRVYLVPTRNTVLHVFGRLHRQYVTPRGVVEGGHAHTGL
jgi:hypothetical protein